MSKQHERRIVAHEPVPGYRTALYIAIAIGLAFLIFVFGKALL